MQNRTLKLLLAIIIATFIPHHVTAQKFKYDVRFGTFIDNGEYNSPYKAPQTMAGAYVIPTVGIAMDTVHRLMVGVSYLQEFGVEPFSRRPDFVAYYNYKARSFSGFAGLLPRSEMRGNYSRALFSDSVGYYNHTIAGALLRWQGERGEIEAFFDWTTLDRTTGAEAFMAGSAGRLTPGRFSVGYSGYMYHYRGAEGSPDFLVDNIMWRLYTGIDLADRTPLDKLYFEMGIIGSNQRGRISATNSGQWISRAGFQGAFNVEWHGWGIEDTFFAGKPLMPLWERYGTRVYWGDAFYNAPIYNRTDIYWGRSFLGCIDLRVAMVLHATAKGLDFCQQATLKLKFGN